MLSQAPPRQARFVVRTGGTGWMVYDRERKGPAFLKNAGFAEKLTKEQAEQLKRALTDAVTPTNTGKPRP
ncbi:hypothetical protein H8A99_42785 [Bradyrhizobium sp. Arg68]|nr:hypothetical protein [Bradyrhizobium ivorense]